MTTTYGAGAPVLRRHIVQVDATLDVVDRIVVQIDAHAFGQSLAGIERALVRRRSIARGLCAEAKVSPVRRVPSRLHGRAPKLSQIAPAILSPLRAAPAHERIMHQVAVMLPDLPNSDLPAMAPVSFKIVSAAVRT